MDTTTDTRYIFLKDYKSSKQTTKIVMPFTTKLYKDVKIGGTDLESIITMGNSCGMGRVYTNTNYRILRFLFRNGYQITEIINEHLEGEFSHNVKCDTIVIDLMGEYVGLSDLKLTMSFLKLILNIIMLLWWDAII